jgi:transcriptional regulator with PAS, ATPase and Fis domain
MDALQEALAEANRPRDVIGEYSANEVELLLVGAEPAEATRIVEQMAAVLKKRGPVQTGVASFPIDGRDPHALIHRASPLPRAREQTPDPVVGSAIISDRRMQDLYRLAERIAAGDISVLVLGETGVGKEVLAERIHRMSPRATKPYLKLNCAAFTETLLESELFGHERGAFTGAVANKRGLLETAEGGTVFLDEVGEMPLSLQVKLLRIIEERLVLPVGGLKPRPIDVRFVAATNRDLEVESTRGTFRSDLFFRLSGATLVIPPLRERTAEIEGLACAFVTQAARRLNQDPQPALTSEALAALLRYDWPGNIRELRNVIERAVLLCAGDPITPAHLPIDRMRSSSLSTQHRPANLEVGDSTARVIVGASRGVPVSDDEKTRIVEALEKSRGNQKLAAEMLGISRRTLLNKLDRFGISGPRKQR